MNRRIKIVAWTLSHAVVFAAGAAWFAGYRIQAAFEAATPNPLYRIGLAMSLQTDENAIRSLDVDLSALSRTAQAPTADVIRLVALLQRGRLEDAGAACTTLAWARCDPETLGEMRKTVAP